MELLTVPEDNWQESAWNATKHPTMQSPHSKELSSSKRIFLPVCGNIRPFCTHKEAILTLKEYFSDVFSTNSHSSLQVLILHRDFR